MIYIFFIKIFNVNDFIIAILAHINDMKVRGYLVIRIPAYYRYFFENK